VVGAPIVDADFVVVAGVGGNASRVYNVGVVFTGIVVTGVTFAFLGIVLSVDFESVLTKGLLLF
jgi:hypothetical protein